MAVDWVLEEQSASSMAQSPLIMSLLKITRRSVVVVVVMLAVVVLVA